MSSPAQRWLLVAMLSLLAAAVYLLVGRGSLDRPLTPEAHHSAPLDTTEAPPTASQRPPGPHEETTRSIEHGDGTEAATSFAPPPDVHLRVVHQNGDVAARALLQFRSSGRNILEITTDRSGAASFRSIRNVDVEVSARKGRARSDARQVDAGEDVLLVLREETPVVFRVLDDETGAPIDGAEITIHTTDRWNNSVYDAMQRGTTNGDGVCRLNAATPTGDVDIRHESYESRVLAGYLEGPALEVINVRLEPCRRWRLRVLDQKQHPIEEARFEAWWPPDQLLAATPNVGEDGFEYLVTARRGAILVSAPGRARRVFELTASNEDPSTVILPYPGYAVFGVALNPPENTKVELFSDRLIRSVFPGKDGRFRFESTRGASPFAVHITSPTGARYGVGFRAEDVQGDVDLGVIELRAAAPDERAEPVDDITRLEGSVVDDLGRPVPFAIVRAFSERDHSPTPPRAFCDAGGRFAIDCETGETGEDTRVLAEAPGFMPVFPSPRATAGTPTTVVLTRSAFLDVEIVGAIPDGAWSLSFDTWINKRSVTAPRHESRARIEVFPGECRYTVAATGFDPVTHTASVLPGEIHRVQVTLAR